MSLSSLYKHHAELCQRMAATAKTAEARQQWNDLAAELRHRADVQEGLMTVTPSADAELEEAPASKDSAVERVSEPEGTVDAALPLPPRDFGSGSEMTPWNQPPRACAESLRRPGLARATSAISAPHRKCRQTKRKRYQEHQLVQTDHATPEEVGTSDPEWEELIADIRSNKRPNKRD